MWSCDLICDFSWLKEKRGRLGSPSFTAKAHSELLNGSIDIHFFSDANALHHVRFILHTDDKDLAQRCIDQNISVWMNSVESGVILQTKRSFSVPKVDGVSGFMTILSPYDGGPHEVGELELISPIEPFDINLVGASMAFWSPDLFTHLHYFRRMIDPGIPLESRWHNAYKLFEWHFVKQHLQRKGKKRELIHSDEWKEFVDRYQTSLAPYLMEGQSSFNLIESVRAMVAHAFLDTKSEKETEFKPGDLIQLTYPIMNRMVVDLLNSLKGTDFPLKLSS